MNHKEGQPEIIDVPSLRDSLLMWNDYAEIVAAISHYEDAKKALEQAMKQGSGDAEKLAAQYGQVIITLNILTEQRKEAWKALEAASEQLKEINHTLEQTGAELGDPNKRPDA